MATMTCPNLFNMHPFHSHKNSVNLPFHSTKQVVNLSFLSRTAFSSFAITRAYAENPFLQLASTKLEMNEDDIVKICRLIPELQTSKSINNVEQLVNYLNQHGFTNVEIAQVLRNEPFLTLLPFEKLEPKIKLLEDVGFQGETLRKLLAISPGILNSSFENSLLPNVMFLKGIFKTKDALVSALLKEPGLLSWNLKKILKPSFAFWKKYGLSRGELIKFFVLAPAALSRTSLTAEESYFIEKIGLDKGSGKFKYLLGAVCLNPIEKLGGRIESLKRWGLSTNEICQILRAAPAVLDSAQQTIRKRMNFLVHDLNVPPEAVVEHPNLLGKSVEQSMRPRFLVWQEMESTTGQELSLLDVLSMTKEKFFELISERPDSETLQTIYEKALSRAPNASTAQRDQSS